MITNKYKKYLKQRNLYQQVIQVIITTQNTC